MSRGRREKAKVMGGVDVAVEGCILGYFLSVAVV